jgi:hypothetical protein
MLTHRSSAREHRPSMLQHRSSVRSHRSSVLKHRSSMRSHRSSALTHQSLILTFRRPRLDDRRAMIECRRGEKPLWAVRARPIAVCACEGRTGTRATGRTRGAVNEVEQKLSLPSARVRRSGPRGAPMNSVPPSLVGHARQVHHSGRPTTCHQYPAPPRAVPQPTGEYR